MIDFTPFWETLKKSKESRFSPVTKHHISSCTLYRLKHKIFKPGPVNIWSPPAIHFSRFTNRKIRRNSPGRFSHTFSFSTPISLSFCICFQILSNSSGLGPGMGKGTVMCLTASNSLSSSSSDIASVPQIGQSIDLSCSESFIAAHLLISPLYAFTKRVVLVSNGIFWPTN